MEIVCSLQDQKVTLQPENTTFRSTWRASFMPSRSSKITIFSHFPCCFYFSFLRVIISEHHRIKTHNFCSGFCLRFCCSLPWPGWQSQLSKEEFTSKMVHSQLFLEHPYMQKLLSCVQRSVFDWRRRAWDSFNSPDLSPERPVEALASQQTNTETTFKLTPDTKTKK